MGRSLIKYAMIVIAVLVLISCNGARTEDINQDEIGDVEGEQVLVLWTHDFPALKEGMENKWIPEFEAANPGVRVEYTAIPYSGEIVSFDTRLLAEVSSGGGPDVWAMASFNFSEQDYIEAGLLAPLDPALFGYDSVEDLVEDYPPNSMNVFVRDGKIYALLNELTTLCLFYNQTMFDEANIPYLSSSEPTSWEDIAAIGQKLYSTDPATGDPVRMGYQFGFFANYPSPQWYSQNFYPVLRQYGQEDYFIKGEPAAETEEMEKAFQLFYDFTHTYHIYDPYFIKDWFAEFSNDRVAMVTAGPWFQSALDPDARFGVAPHPVVDPNDPGTYHDVMYSFGWVVNANIEPGQQKLAQEFLAFFLGGKGEAGQPVWWLENVGLLQPRTAFLKSPAYQEIIDQDDWMRCFIDTFRTYHVDYYQHSSDEAGMALVRAMDRVIYDRMSPIDTTELLQNELLLLP